MKYQNVILSGVSLYLALPAMAVFPFDISTTSGPNPTVNNGSWNSTGTIPGTLQANQNPSGYLSGTDDLVVGTNGGTLVITGGYLGTTALQPGGDKERLQNTSLGASISFAINSSDGSGKADFVISNSKSSDGDAGLLYNSFGLRNFSGSVDSVTLSLTYNQFMGGRDDYTYNSGVDSGTRYGPMLSAMGLLNAGSDAAASNWDLSLTYSDVGWSSNSADFTGGPIPGAATAFAPPSVDTPVGGSLSLFSADGFTGLVTAGASDPTKTNGGNYFMARGYNMDGMGDWTPTDAERFYAKTVTYTFAPTGDFGGAAAAFSADTHFTFSMDGEQYSNLGSVVPEPSSSGLLALVISSGSVLYRRRR